MFDLERSVRPIYNLYSSMTDSRYRERQYMHINQAKIKIKMKTSLIMMKKNCT